MPFPSAGGPAGVLGLKGGEELPSRDTQRQPESVQEPPGQRGRTRHQSRDTQRQPESVQEPPGQGEGQGIPG